MLFNYTAVWRFFIYDRYTKCSYERYVKDIVGNLETFVVDSEPRPRAGIKFAKPHSDNVQYCYYGVFIMSGIMSEDT